MILVDALPLSVELGGEEYPINTDFRYWILFEQMMQDREIDDFQKMAQAIDLFFGNDSNLECDFQEIMDAILWFYSCGKSESNGKSKGANKRQEIYDYETDEDYIFAAFLDQYGIDLTTDRLHWWKFRALFKSLKSDNEIVKIMGYRAMEISSDMPKEQQKFYREMKELYRLEDGRTAEEKEQDFNESFAALF